MNKIEAICAALLDTKVAVHGGFVSSTDGINYRYQLRIDSEDLDDDCVDYINVPKSEAISVSRDKEDPTPVANWLASLAYIPRDIEMLVPAEDPKAKLKDKKLKEKKKGLSGLKLN
ncbi:MAG TPA: hypothetical protein DD435_05250 [Cyanobacteria bacterium UBA8530]|nr:hypothetical protein [Cyanobacteria bacterium UBA8530]